MKKIFFMSLLALSIVAAGCSKDKDNDEVDLVPMPTKSGTTIVDKNVVYTQVVEGKAVEITYFFDEGVKYNHQEWKIIFSTTTGATTAGLAAKAKYLTKPNVQVSYSVNVVNINYPLGEGLGDEQFQKVTKLEEVEDVIQILDILGLLSLF